MNIKSELNKPISFFKSISLGMVLVAVLLASILGLTIIAIGEGFWVKIIFLSLASVIAAVNAFDNSSVYPTKDDQNKAGLRNIIIIVITALFMEIPLSMNATTTKTIPVTTTFSNEKKTQTDKNGMTNVTEFKQLKIIDLNNNSTMGYRNFNKNNKDEMNLWLDITAKEYYIDYLPFFVYSEEFRYKRN